MEDANKPYRLGAIAYIHNPVAKTLLLVNLNSYKGDEWNMPGGGRDPGETAAQNIVREVREELGLTPDHYTIAAQDVEPLVYDFPSEFMQSGNLRAAEYRGQQKDRFLLYFSGDPAAVRPDPNEVRHVMWCPLDQLETHLRFPGQFEDTVATLQRFGVL